MREHASRSTRVCSDNVICWQPNTPPQEAAGYDQLALHAGAPGAQQREAPREHHAYKQAHSVSQVRLSFCLVWKRRCHGHLPSCEVQVFWWAHAMCLGLVGPCVNLPHVAVHEALTDFAEQ